MYFFIRRYSWSIGVILGLIFMGALLVSNDTHAHPGNTASDGGHYCRTNCENWGYEYGTRHYHGGDTSTGGTSINYSALYDQALEDSAKYASETNRAYIESEAKQDGAASGYSDGIENDAEEEQFLGIDTNVCDEVVFSTEPNIYYKSTYLTNYESVCDEIYLLAYKSSYAESYINGNDEYRIEQERLAEEATKRNVNLGILALMVFGVISLVYIGRAIYRG